MSESQHDFNNMFGGSTLEVINHYYIQFANTTEEARFYFDTLVEFIESQEKKSVQHLKQVAEKVPDNRKGEFWEYNYPYHWRGVFEENLKTSFVISLFSILEFYLKCICQVIYDGKSKKLEEYNKKERFPENFRQYLKGYKSLDLSSLDWDSIKKLWQIRCIIVHNQGLCSIEKEDEKKLEEFTNENDGISITNSCINIDLAFCKRALLTVNKFGIDIGMLIRNYLTNH
jgi:hypothetical protein